MEATWLDSRRGVSLKLTSLLEPLKGLNLGWGRSCVPCVPLLAVINPHAESSVCLKSTTHQVLKSEYVGDRQVWDDKKLFVD